ncbi:helix-turn-helix domain-containing protein [Rhodothalassium salexigens]|nr:helix-turn-helix domain-containing protein [Rhodothalassium salexigens]
MPSVGDQLRRARLGAGLSLEQVAAALNIRRGQLSALEDGRCDDLPAAAFALGFVRAYAGWLGLDVTALADQYKAERAMATMPTQLTFKEPEAPRRPMPGFAVLASSMAAAVMLYFGVVKDDGDGAQARTAGGGEVTVASSAGFEPAVDRRPVEPRPADLQTAGRRDRATVQPAHATAAAEPMATPAVQRVLAPPRSAFTRDSAMAARADRGAVVAPGASGADRGAAASAARPLSAATADRPAVSLTPGDDVWLLEATDAVWVQVTGTEQADLFSGLLKPGQRRLVPVEDGRALTVSNAQALVVRRGDEVYRELGGYGKVLEDVALDRDSLQSLAQIALR